MDPELQRRAHAKAAELGITFAEYVRRLIAHDLGEPRRYTRISLLFDLGASREPTDKDRCYGKPRGPSMFPPPRAKAAGNFGAPRPRQEVVERLRQPAPLH
jgi:hypothetical protein